MNGPAVVPPWLLDPAREAASILGIERVLARLQADRAVLEREVGTLKEQADSIRVLLAALNRLRAAFDRPPLDLAAWLAWLRGREDQGGAPYAFEDQVAATLQFVEDGLAPQRESKHG